MAAHTFNSSSVQDQPGLHRDPVPKEQTRMSVPVMQQTREAAQDPAWHLGGNDILEPAGDQLLPVLCLQSVRSCLSYKRHPGRFWLSHSLAPSHSSCPLHRPPTPNTAFSSAGPAAPSPGSLGRRGHMAGPMPRSLYLGA